MKTIFRAFLIFCLGANAAFAAMPAEYEAAAKQLELAIGTFRAFSKPKEALNLGARRDPMQPLIDTKGNVISSSGTRGELVVQGIIWSEAFKTVLIDDEFYGEGDTVGSYRILEIRSNGFFAQDASNKKIFIPYEPKN